MRKIYFSLFAALLFSVNSMAGDVVTFEEIEVNADGYQNDFGEESCFELGGFTFNNNYFPEWSYWSGFAVSSRTETTFTNLTPDQYNSCVGHGVNGSAKYCVVYPQGEEIEVDEAGGTVISGFYVTNEAWAVDAILNGDGMTPGGFTTGDWYKLTVIGTHADETTEQVEFYLADYRSENAADHYYVKDWQWVDLTALGQVESVTFRLDSSRKNDWGMTTPGYFCIDDFNGVAPALEGVVTFEEIEVNADGYQNDFGEESCFELGGFTFNSNYFPEWSYWSGFAVSSRTETTFANLIPDQFNSCVGHGVNGSAKYCVVYPQGEEIEVNDPEGKVISGFYVTNEAWAVDAILNGDGMTPGGFTTGDWYKLTIIGTHADETTEQVEFYLADYRSENEADRYYVKDWQWVDLTALGQVVSVTFRLDSSRKNDWGMTTPGYFCIDDFNGVAPATMPEGVVTFEEIALNADGYQNDFGEESCFELGGFTFNNNYFPEWSYWSGFAVSSRTETTFANLTPDQYNSCVGHGVHGSEKYCVVYPQGEEIEVNDPEGKVISGFYVTNEAWAVDAILNGDGMTPGGFTTGDWYKLTVIGTHADETTSSVDVYLADYRSENAADHYYINYWQWVDLTALGQVVSVTFRLDSSRKNDWGMTTPGYFCIDDFNGVPDETASIRHHFTAPSTTATSIHTLDGKAISSLQRGINIVRMSDGSVRKVVVK